MALLIQLRWLAVGGQLATIGIVTGPMGISLQRAPLLAAVLVLIAINFASLALLRRGRAVTNAELTAVLLFDVAALGWQLHHSGGLANPFASLFLLQVVIGAMLLTPASSWAIVVAALAAIGVLAVDPTPLLLPPPYAADPMGLYLKGSLVCFLLIAVLLVAFVTRISRNLRERDAALAASRQRAVEEDHIVRMGLLASGAAHELGTPLSTLSVLIGDWKTAPAIARDTDLQQDLADMDAAVRRCKAIVSGILMSAGEARGEAPQVTTMRAFLTALVEEARAGRMPGTVEFNDLFGADLAIISDPALRQVIGNVLDNASEVSPEWIALTASRDGGMAVIEISDRGPGFSDEMIERFGQPYSSTKGRPGGGLGLFLLVNVLRKLGGSASVANRDAGGAVVRVVLPLSAVAAEGEAV
ncbi:histidine kinase [Sphingopyxis sp. H071]|nr:histidine kinase [Sphingopyxis sp. H057]KTE53065.1 histidine kinase [Sphingopyxis sp. H073]KTE55253.1 histidine kinase [Sphingopyxis sp. H071]KTE62534.1 histidine kinase [Sphingopyxis sp. H107]KTE66079.1 histidine kinase [Sphingopyxis sp. H100]KTE73631.1 histidine kinase [Sphingopyxis sp. H081]KTE80967.1 histidine kinase [Sphingopyxis sp. H067]